jgi:MFS transporter, FSR family, fosmidomycin resistance protein
VTSMTTQQVQNKVRRQALQAACGAHAIHDGLTDLIYVLLPIWQTQFAISYAVTGLMRTAYAGAMAGLQIPAGRLARRWGRKSILVAGTAVAGFAYLLAGQAGALAGVCFALVLGGMGASTQHPLASSLVADSHERHGSRPALATYNFAGDLGKMLLPAAVGLALSWWSWQQSVTMVGLLAIGAAGWLAWMIPALARPAHVAANDAREPDSASPGASAGFFALLATGVVDSVVRMGFLTFLPFVLKNKGAPTETIGLALSLLFVGGAGGKLVCAYLGSRIGMMKTVWLTEAGTALAILAILVLPLPFALALLPALGIALNGTSSVLYGTVPELSDGAQREHAFALFYTGTIGGGAVAPLLFGLFSDHLGFAVAMQGAAALALLTLPLAWLVNRELDHG